MSRFYIAYGSNLDIHQMQFRCPGAEPVGTAEIKDYELLFKGSLTGAYLTIEPKTGSSVPVGIWAVSPKNEAALDRYEGFPAFYYKKDFDLLCRDFETGKETPVRAFAYIMHEERLPGIPTQHYINTCLRGYEDFNFDRDILAAAVRNSWDAAAAK